jgi:Ca-activated chloride channel family protein
MWRFANPIYLLFIPLALGLIFFYFKLGKTKSASLKYSDLNLVKRLKPSFRLKQRHILPIFRALVIIFLAFSLARPQSGRKSQEVSSEGIDIMLILDISGTMQMEDFKPKNRLYVAKQVIRDFIKGRETDRIGLVIFSKQAFTQCPLTLDYGVLLDFLDKVEFGMIEDGTAIGMGIATAVNRLRETPGKSKVIVLATDGVNNAGEIDPLTAAQVASAMKVKIYTVGVGKPGYSLFPVQDPFFGKRYVYAPGNEVDEPTLKKIASLTGGKYFRATDEKVMLQIYNQISGMEKTKIKVKEYLQYNELFQKFALAGLIFLVLEIVLAHTRFRKIP